MHEVNALRICCSVKLRYCCKKETSFREAGLITVSFVDVSPDLRNASVYFTCLQPACAEEVIVDLLNGQAGHLRHLLAQVLPLRGVPQLTFRFDHTPQPGEPFD